MWNPRPNPVTPALLGHYDEGSGGFRVLSVLFNNHWRKIKNFCDKNNLPMPISYLGQGETGIVLDAGKYVVKILTSDYNDQAIDEDLAFAKFFLNTSLPGFIKIKAILPITALYWRNPSPTFVIWEEKIDTSGLAAIAKANNTNLVDIRKQFRKIENYAEIAFEAMESYQSMSVREFEIAKETIRNYLSSVRGGVFAHIFSSLDYLLSEDIIVSDLHMQNLGVRWNRGRATPVFFDGKLHHV